MNTTAERTEKLQRGRPFKPGQSGNPQGRPRGSRNKITKLLLDLVEAEVAKSTQGGTGSLAALRESDPATFWRLVASLVPRELEFDTRPPVTFTMIIDGEEKA